MQGGHAPSLDSLWGSTSTCSTFCTALESIPSPTQTTWQPHSHSPWSLSLDPPPSWAPRPIPSSTLPSSSQRTDMVRGARGRRPSVVDSLLKESAYHGEVDVSAFHRYYEGSTLGTNLPGVHSSPHREKEDQICGASGTIGGTLASLGVFLPTKLEALLKLLAQSLHLVLQALCSRKARRKDRECSSAHEHKLYLEEAVLERNIPETDLRQLVDLPPGLGYEEWLASHTIDFFHHINLFYGTVCEFCTLTGCPDMTGPGLRQYLWFDEKGKKTRVAAPQYVDYVMTFTQNTVNDETIFPTKFENDFPSSFESIVKKIHRLLFHVVAHLYHAHFREVVLLSLHAHLNCLFAHFVLFSEKFGLIDHKETEILHDLVRALKIHPETERDAAPCDASSGTEDGSSAPICIAPSFSAEGPLSGSPIPGATDNCYSGSSCSPHGDGAPVGSLGAEQGPCEGRDAATGASVPDNSASLSDSLTSSGTAAEALP